MTDTTLWLAKHKPESGLEHQPEDEDTYVAEIFRSKNAVRLQIHCAMLCSHWFVAVKDLVFI